MRPCTNFPKQLMQLAHSLVHSYCCCCYSNSKSACVALRMHPQAQVQTLLSKRGCVMLQQHPSRQTDLGDVCFRGGCSQASTTIIATTFATAAAAMVGITTATCTACSAACTSQPFLPTQLPPQSQLLPTCNTAANCCSYSPNSDITAPSVLLPALQQ